jgi:glyoxylase-like metal-dependent hydrolase (beta-lactamase superfamily II)
MCQPISRYTGLRPLLGLPGLTSELRGLAAATLVLAATAPPVAAQGPLRATHVAGAVHRIDGAVDVIGASVGRDGVLLVDAGYARTVAELRSVLRRFGTDRPRILVNTHWHHAFANESIGPSTVIVAHSAVRSRLGRTNDMAGRVIPPQSPAGWPVVTFEDSLTIHFNGERITLVHLPRAHTDGDVAVVFHGSKVVMTGDAYVPHLPWIDLASGGRLDGLVRATDLLLRITPRDAKIVPGHGPTTSYADLARFREMLDDNIAHVRRQIAAGRSLEDVQSAGVPERWRSWEGGVPQRMFLEGVYRGLAERPPAGAASSALVTSIERRTYEYRGGQWLGSAGFVPGTWYAVDGLLTRRRPVRVDSVIDLAGRFVVPPYADAHRHDLANESHIADDVQALLKSGVFYAMVQDAIDVPTDSVRRAVNVPSSVDVAHAYGVITPSWGVIAELYRMLAARGRFGAGATLKIIDTKNVVLVDDAADLRRKWPTLAARRPDFIKVILAFSEDHARRRANPTAFGFEMGRFSARAGLDPALLPELVRLAHESGLRVSAHIETATDFRTAIAAGVDVIAHLPGAWQIGAQTGLPAGSLEPWLITREDAAEAARRGVTVVTTAAKDSTHPEYASFVEVHRRNIAQLRRAGVRLAIGTDGARGGVVREVEFLTRIGALDAESALRILTQNTPELIFPGRPLGRLEEGTKATFLALDGNPLHDAARLGSIAVAVKDGVLLERSGH